MLKLLQGLSLAVLESRSQFKQVKVCKLKPVPPATILLLHLMVAGLIVTQVATTWL